MTALARSAPVRAPVRRSAAVLCLAGVALTHISDLGHHAQDAPYLAASFIGLIAASVLLALLIARLPDPEPALRAAGLLAAAAIAGYVYSRTVGLPGLGDHVGYWADPAGLAALTCEGALVALAGVPPVAFAATVGLLGITAGGVIEQARGSAAPVHAHEHGDAHQHEPADRHGAHVHDARRGRAHMYVTLDGRIRFGPEPPVTDPTPAELRAATRLLRRSRRSARRFPTVRAARALGYRVDRERPPWDRSILRPHLTHPGYTRDPATLDPDRPESLVYLRGDAGRLRLIAFMFRAPVGPTTDPARRFIRWHVHGGCVRSREARGTGTLRPDRRCAAGRSLLVGATMMQHLWLTDDVHTAFALDPPG